MSRALLVLMAVAIALWAAATFWFSQRSSSAAFALLAACGMLLMLFARGVRLRAGRTGDSTDGPRAARFVVTQMLAELTRVQVAFLSQEFSSEQEGQKWLKQAVPRAFRGALPELSGDLEQARRGNPPQSLRLPLRILALKRQLESTERALEVLSPRYPGYEVARPVAFVVTENVSMEGDREPLVRSLAAWDPSKPTLIPRVDVLTICSADQGKCVIQGQIDFINTTQALEPHLERTEEVAGERVRVCKGIILAQLGLPFAKPPIGFVVGDSGVPG